MQMDELEYLAWALPGWVPGGAVRQLARRLWMDHRGLVPDKVVQVLTVRPRPDGLDARSVHDDLAHWDHETRGWALVTIADAGVDFVRCQASIRILDTMDVADWQEVGLAPNADPDLTPLNLAIDDTADAQRATNRAEARRVACAVAAWREAQVEEGDPTAHGTPYQKGFFFDLGMQLQVAPRTAETLVHAAEALQRHLPLAWSRFTSGAMPWRAMQTVYTQFNELDPGLYPAFDAAAARKLDDIAVPLLRDALRRLKEKLQPATADARHESAFAKRKAEFELLPDAMGRLTIDMAAADLLAIKHQAVKGAIAAHGEPGETRTIPQLVADVLRDGLIGGLAEKPGTGTDPLVPARPAVVPRVGILIPAMTALGHSDVQPVLQGYGPIGIATAMKLAGAAKSWIRVLTDPFSGTILNLGRKKYRPTKDMRDLIRMLDGGGRGPVCPRGPDETEFDHNQEFRDPAENGETSVENLVLLSRADHILKSEDELGMRLLGDRTLVTEARSGHKWATRPHDVIDPTPIPDHLVARDETPF